MNTDLDDAKYWHCTLCGKYATSLNPDKGEAAPEHVSYRGIDIGTCKGQMQRISREEWENGQ